MIDNLKETIELLNPWWKNNEISKELARPYKRDIFENISKLINYRQIIILSGLRRVGKTTLLYQIIENLIPNNKSGSIFYFNFDKKAEDLINILNAYGEFAGVNWKKEKIYVFLDEISKLNDWANQVKLIYDSFLNIKFFLSSSSSTNLEEEAIKNLSGRYFLINIPPLSFSEYLKLGDKDELLKNINLYEKELKKEFNNYLIRSFPEIINWKDELLIKDYLRTTIIDKIIKTDLPDKFKNIDKNLLFSLINMFYTNPGIYLHYDNISKNLGISKKTLVRHIFYLEFSYLIRKIKNFRPSVFATTRKMQKVYPYWWSLAYIYSDNFDKIMENLVASILDLKNYWRDGGKEIDFLFIKDKKIIPIEIKNKKEVDKNELKNMIYFFKKYNYKEGWIIYNGSEKSVNIEKIKIKFVPLWKFLLKKDYITK